jgi:WD40 repeat protein/DNA-binding SARP family transcriptional activator
MQDRLTAQVRVLGPLDVSVAGRTVPLGGAQQRLLFAALALHVNAVVSADVLVDLLWGEQPPDNAGRTLPKYLYRLRGALDTAAETNAAPRLHVETRPSGYALVLDGAEFDADRFVTLVRDAHDCTERDPSNAARLLDDAVALWRGRAWAEFADDHELFRADATRLETLREEASEDRADVGLLLGRHSELLADLEATVVAFPLRERPRAQLMLALYRCGRHAEALRAFQSYRTFLRDEIGLEPSAALQRLEDDMILQKPDLDLPAHVTRTAAAPSRRTALDVHGLDSPFVGRSSELDWLEVLWARAAAGEPLAALVCGAGGIGKTRLVAEFARRLHNRGTAIHATRGDGADVAPQPAPDGAPMLVVLDDLDGLDESPRDLIRKVVARCGPTAGVLVVGVALDDPSQGSASPEAEEADLLVHVRTVTGLAARDVAVLLEADARTVAPELVEAVWAETAGNPALVVEIGRRLRAEDIAVRLDRALARAGTANSDLRVAHDEIAAGVLARRDPPSGDPPRGSPVGAAVLCPYKGLACFDGADAPWFCGRDRLVATLVAEVAVSRFVAVVGASGSGKSSLVRAGLIPALTAGALPGSERWTPVIISPGSDPVGSLADGLSRMTDDSVGERVVVVIDQFEEVFTVCRDEGSRDQFIAALVDSAADADAKTAVVVVVRADYYGACASHPELARRLERSQVIVGAMTDAELRRAITEPATRAGLRVEEEVIDAVRRDADGEPGALPLVSTALLETWVHRRSDTLTMAAYVEAGGVRGALARLADRFYDDLAPPGRAIARRVLLRLAELGEGNDDVRRRAPRAELDAIDGAEAVLAGLVDRRLAIVDDGTVEVAHEALLREWPRLRGWLEEDRDGRRLHRRLSDAAVAWDAASHDPAELYRGTRLDAATEWIGAHPDDPTALEIGFIDASVAAHTHEIRRARRRTRALAVLLAVALIAALVSVAQWRSANSQTSRANSTARVAEAGRLAATARTESTDRHDLALLLAVQGHRLLPSTDTEGALATALNRTPPGLDQIVRYDSPAFGPSPSPDGRLLAVPGADGNVRVLDLRSGRIIQTLAGPPQALVASFSPDGSQVVAGSDSGTVTVWDVATGRTVGVPIHPAGKIVEGEFDPADPTQLFTVSDQGQAVRWDRHDPDHPRTVGEPFGFDNPVENGIPGDGIPPIETISPDGQLLALSTAAFTGSTVVFDIATHTLLHELSGRAGLFGPDSTTIVTCDENQGDVYNARTGQLQGPPLTGFSVAVPVAIISPDGQRVAIRDNDADHSIRVFDLGTHQPVGAVSLPPGGSGGFLPDGRLLASTNTEATIWRVGATVGPLGVPIPDRHEPNPRYTVLAGRDHHFLRGGAEIETIGFDTHQAARYDTATGAPIGPPSPLGDTMLDISPDGTLAAVGLPDGTIALRDWPTGRTRGILDGHRSGETRATWDPTGHVLLTSSTDQTILVWTVTDPDHATLAGPITAPGNVPTGTSQLFPQFDNRGGLVAVVDKNSQTVTVFDTATREQLWTHHDPDLILEVSFNPDDTRLAVAIGTAFSSAAHVTVWDAQRGTPGDVVHQNDIEGVAYVRGGTALAIVSDAPNAGGVTQLWDTTTLRPVGDPLVTPALGQFLSASPDENNLVVNTLAGYDIVWDLDIHHWDDSACRIAGRNLTKAEWQQYLPDQPYQATCPQWPPGA